MRRCGPGMSTGCPMRRPGPGSATPGGRWSTWCASTGQGSWTCSRRRGGTAVGEILAEEGFGRLIRRPEPEASISAGTPGRDTNLPRAQVIDFAAWPARLESTRAGLLLVLPDLAALDLPALAAAAGYPGTSVIPAAS